jgi:hypothetical protein
MREASMGVTVNETRSEKRVAKVTVSANSLRILPSMPDIMAMGTKTTTLVRVEAMTAVAISEVPRSAESMRLWPICL